MDSERWRQIKTILDEAQTLPPAEVSAFLDSSCAGDPDLRSSVKSLLADEPGGFGPYRVIREIGRGGMGVVYEALDPRLGRHVALKLLPREWGWHPEVKERFLREARAASTFDHPNICTIFDLGEHDDGSELGPRLYLVMALYRGETLKQKLERGPLEIDEAVRILVRVGRGLECAHAAGIIHRDVKPANVMMTEDGEPVLLDFGLAKAAGDVGLTRTGQAPGTPSYMSPEAILGDPMDHRTDIWALGVMLYEMLAGHRPFRGDDARGVVHRITLREPEPLASHRSDLPPAVAAVVTKALAKEPGMRYQTVRELVADLEPETATARIAVAAGRRRRLAAAAVLALAVGLGGWWTVRTGDNGATVVRPAASAPLAEASRPSLAVLYFRNLTGDPQLDWLHVGITEMLVTDIKQSPEIDVLATPRLRQILAELDAVDQDAPPLDLILQVARKAAAGAVVQGSYARAGDVLRITYSVYETATGEDLDSRSVQGRGEESLFSLIDEISAAIRNNFDVARSADNPGSVADMTTSSLTALRLYYEGLALQQEAKTSEAITRLEKAVEIDPTFALALADLGWFYSNLGRADLARDYRRQAIEHAERLPPTSRYGIEGGYYADRWVTYGQGIEAYEAGSRSDPKDDGFRINLALLYMYHERYAEALAEYQKLIGGETAFAPAYVSAANAHTALGQPETAARIMIEFQNRHPDNWYGHFGLGWQQIHSGRLDEAAAALRRAAALRPDNFLVHDAMWRIAILRQERRRAELESAALMGLDDLYPRWLGAVSRARELLYRGMSAAALSQLEAAIEVYDEPGAYTALTHCWKAEILRHRGDAGGALAEAVAAQREGPGDWPELQGLFEAALAAAKLGREDDAERSLQSLRRAWKSHPNRVEERQIRMLEGLLALAQGDTGAALTALGRAEELLPPRGVWIHWHYLPNHVPVWYALGTAELAAGRLDAARGWFEKVTTSGAEHVDFPVPYVRSFYQLGRIYEHQGRTREARRQLEQFLDHRRDGDLDRDWVDAVKPDA